LSCTRWGFRAGAVAGTAVRSYRTFSPLLIPDESGPSAVCFCGTVRTRTALRFHARLRGWWLLATTVPVVFGLSSRLAPSGRLIIPFLLYNGIGAKGEVGWNHHGNTKNHELKVCAAAAILCATFAIGNSWTLSNGHATHRAATYRFPHHTLA